MRTWIALAVLALTATLLPATGATAASKHTTQITTNLRTATHKAGARVNVTGKVTGSTNRPVHLQSRGANGTWVTLASGRTSATGTYTIALPTWWVTKRTLRAHAPATRTDTAASAAKTAVITITRPYKPRAGTTHRLSEGRWDPCRIINYRVNPTRMPKGGLADIKHAVAQVRQATGLRFRYAGTTTFIPYRKNQAPWYYPDNADLVFAWATPNQVPILTGSTAMYGGANITTEDGIPGAVRHSGFVLIDTSHRYAKKQKTHNAMRRNLVLKTLGIAIGLRTVNDKRQVMYADRFQTYPRFGNGDLRGLAALGANTGCNPIEPFYFF